LDVEFPIIGQLRMPLLIIEYTFMIICFELGIIYLIKYRKQKEEMKPLQIIGYASLFFSYSLMTLFFIIADYYTSDVIETPFIIWRQGSVRAIFLNLGYFSLIIGVFLFIFVMENYKIYAFKKYFFTKCFLILIIIFSIFFFIDIQLTQNLALMFWPLFFLFLVIYIVDYVKIAKTNEKVILKELKILSIFLLLGFGFFLTTDASIGILGLGSRLIGSIIQLIAVVLLFFLFLSLPLSELDWQGKIEEIWVLIKGGICLYHKNFKKKIEFVEEDLISGAIASVGMMLNELSTSKGKLSIIKKKGKAVYVFTSDYITAVLICKEELNIINFLLKKFVQKFEAIYYKVLIDFDGDKTIFTPVDSIVKEIFMK